MLRDFKTRKTAGINGIQAEFWKEAGEQINNKLFKFIKDIFNLGNLPLNLVKCKIIPILKKKKTETKCVQYCTTNYSKKNGEKVGRNVEVTFLEDQFGFRKNMGFR